MTFGDTVRDARMREKITLRKFAEMVGVSPTYISQIERDEHACSLMLCRIVSYSET